MAAPDPCSPGLRRTDSVGIADSWIAHSRFTTTLLFARCTRCDHLYLPGTSVVALRQPAQPFLFEHTAPLDWKHQLLFLSDTWFRSEWNCSGCGTSLVDQNEPASCHSPAIRRVRGCHIRDDNY